MKALILALLLALAVPMAVADGKPGTRRGDKVYMNETVISGNQELPRVLYILPWRNDPGKALKGQAPTADMGGILTPVYPDQFRREMRYRAMTHKHLNH